MHICFESHQKNCAKKKYNHILHILLFPTSAKCGIFPPSKTFFIIANQSSKFSKLAEFVMSYTNSIPCTKYLKNIN